MNPSTSKADLITHPVRARIILSITGRTLTTQQIAVLLPDIPRASLYRHIRELAAADILSVKGETRIRGTLEKIYFARPEAVLLSPEEMENTSHEQYLRLVTSFLSGMIHVYQAYLAEQGAGLSLEAAARSVPLYLSTDEFQTLKRQLLELIEPLKANEFTSERRRRLICILGVPDQPDPPQQTQPTDLDKETQH